eukprot:COSAG04_NODE_10943_length_742_cov_0.948678_1_plen_167_part_00
MNFSCAMRACIAMQARQAGCGAAAPCWRPPRVPAPCRSRSGRPPASPIWCGAAVGCPQEALASASPSHLPWLGVLVEVRQVRLRPDHTQPAAHAPALFWAITTVDVSIDRVVLASRVGSSRSGVGEAHGAAGAAAAWRLLWVLLIDIDMQRIAKVWSARTWCILPR